MSQELSPVSRTSPFGVSPTVDGLYDSRFEHDGCGVSFVVDVKGRKSHDIVMTGVGALCNLEHRGATGAETNTGDGAGILIQLPDRFFRSVVGFELPEPGFYGAGLAFLPLDQSDADKTADAFEHIVRDEGLTVLGWRDVPTDPSTLGPTTLAVLPSFRQVFISDPNGASGIDLER
ncbi:MAG: glutamate synthase subunit alpha, partial [Acidimicrobiia bacterium]